MDGISPPQFEEEQWEKKSWFSSIFRFVQRRTKTVVITSSDSPYSVPADVSWVWANATSGAITVNLPTVLDWWGREIGVAKTDASANAVTVSRSGTDTINGATSVSLAVRYYNLLVKADGVSSWYIISRFPAVAG